MHDSRASFWQLLGAVHEKMLVGDEAAAWSAIQEARKAVGEGPQYLATRRHEMLNAVSRMIEPPRVATSHGLLMPAAPRGVPVSFASAHVHDLAPAALRVLVSGIGRSGTTLIYQQLAKLLLLDSRRANFRYEPYLWNIRSSQAKGNSFDMSQLHNLGMLAHSSAPLFLDGTHPDHDRFIEGVFNAAWDRDAAKWPDAYLAKIIRGSGRLRSYLRRHPDLKIVACLRNPVDTINSSLGMFSFFGEEFHVDDRPRFRAELSARGRDVSQLEVPPRSIEWYANWWRVFTEETLAVADEYPDNVMLFCYEAFQEAQNETLESLMEFTGVRNLGIFMGLNEAAGPRIKATSLTRHDIGALQSHVDYYMHTVLKSRLGHSVAVERTESTIARCLDGQFSFPIAGSDIGRRCPIQLRSMMLRGVKSPFMALVQRPAYPVSLDAIVAQHRPTGGADPTRPAAAATALKKGKRFGAVVTCYNNVATIVDAVLSCLNQTLPFDEIVVVNDKSSDDSSTLLAELGERYSCLRIVELHANVGPSAARDLGIRKLTTDFFTQLDGDDLFWPTKNAQEAEAIDGDESVVAFSDIMLLHPKNNLVQDTASYHAKTGTQAWLALLGRTPQIPRDLTASRRNYFKAGGYDVTRSLYEDWDFKLRLALVSGRWIRAGGLCGTLYNRLSPGLSNVDGDEHAKALSQVFLSAIKNVPQGELMAPLEAFDNALGRFSAQPTAVSARAAVVRGLAWDAGISALSDLVMRRDIRAMDTRRYAGALEAFATKPAQRELEG